MPNPKSKKQVIASICFDEDRKDNEREMVRDFFETFELELQPKELKWKMLIDFEEFRPRIIKFMRKYAQPQK